MYISINDALPNSTQEILSDVLTVAEDLGELDGNSLEEIELTIDTYVEDGDYNGLDDYLQYLWDAI